jgi:hypothetical protein
LGRFFLAGGKIRNDLTAVGLNPGSVEELNPMVDTEKAEAPNDKKQTRSGPSKASPVDLGEGLESPRSPHC